MNHPLETYDEDELFEPDFDAPMAYPDTEDYVFFELSDVMDSLAREDVMYAFKTSLIDYLKECSFNCEIVDTDLKDKFNSHEKTLEFEFRIVPETEDFDIDEFETCLNVFSYCNLQEFQYGDVEVNDHITVCLDVELDNEKMVFVQNKNSITVKFVLKLGMEIR